MVPFSVLEVGSGDELCSYSGMSYQDLWNYTVKGLEANSKDRKSSRQNIAR